ncbi:YeeE/YedE thiosulfate transporter family protein [Selenihalanaerobacter shriftii]|uniref:Uncharacterized protein n=1 Tax=Selenihalanaerobacter shriftii TaxID=142842 RepID=A0A1T4JUT8_9FIRM|nr:YeeE/YedE thiosulfate transporter family protein [Selenihalanaerobacter shriftii]SJZ33827.1 hypothetical protein SAMN02745118_00421 [Selenihalanaerobacter shriftii]
MDKNKKEQLIGFMIILIIAVVIELNLLQLSVRIGLFWIIGLLIGFVLQRANFCFAGGFLNLILFKDTKLVKAIIILLGISTVGFAVHQYLFFTNYHQIIGRILPWGIFTVVGGLLFGLGMSLAGGCACSSLVKMGEGTVTFILVIVGLIIGSTIAVGHLDWWRSQLIMEPVFFPKYLGWFKAIILQLIFLVLIYLYTKWLDKYK